MTFSSTLGHQTHALVATLQSVLGTHVLQVDTVVVAVTLVIGASITILWNTKSLTQINQCVGTHL